MHLSAGTKTKVGGKRWKNRLRTRETLLKTLCQPFENPLKLLQAGQKHHLKTWKTLNHPRKHTVNPSLFTISPDQCSGHESRKGPHPLGLGDTYLDSGFRLRGRGAWWFGGETHPASPRTKARGSNPPTISSESSRVGGETPKPLHRADDPTPYPPNAGSFDQETHMKTPNGTPQKKLLRLIPKSTAALSNEKENEVAF